MSLTCNSAVATVFTATLLALNALRFADRAVVTINSDYLHKSTNSVLYIMATVSVYWRRNWNFKSCFYLFQASVG
jgi:hypothetical protein